MIIVYGGCQADEPGRDTPRLPSDAVEDILARIRGLLQSLQPKCLVGALASGSDILFARATLEEGIPLRVLLPFDADTFRKTSVEPAGQPWIGDYQRIVTTTGKYKGTDKDKIAIDDAHLDPADADVYHKHNVALLDHAAALARPGAERVWLLSVRPKPNPLSPSVTDDLMSRAEERGMLALDIDPLPPSRRSGFVVMPYGKKKDPRVNRFLECDPAFHKVYRPLLEDFNVDWTRADLLTDSGLIHSAMLSDLANSDLVVADLSAINFNVAYELGIRHVFASRATVLIDPSVTSFKRGAPPFDINMIRTHTFERGPDDVTDEQAEKAIDALREVMVTALEPGKWDSPCHEWFDLGQIVRPFQPRAAVPQFRRAGKNVRDAVAAATRSADPDKMRAEALNVATAPDVSNVARRACRIELAAGLLNEGAYDDARKLLELAKPGPDDPPPDEDPLHRTWLHKTVMAYRRLGEQTTDEAEQRKLWNVAKQYLLEAEEAGYRDSETYGIWGGLLKRQLERQRAGMDKAVAQSLFAEMEQRYRSGFELDPDYYTGVNVVMALRWSGRPRDAAFARDFNELLTVSRFLAQVARKEDPQDFWATVTLAELTLHEALERGADLFDVAVGQYADAGRIGRPDGIKSARFQLEFMRQCGDRGDVIDRALAALPLPVDERGQ